MKYTKMLLGLLFLVLGMLGIYFQLFVTLSYSLHEKVIALGIFTVASFAGIYLIKNR